MFTGRPEYARSQLALGFRMTTADQASNLLHEQEGVESPIDLALKSVRTHLGMQVAYLSEFVENRSVFRGVDAPGLEHLIKVGDSQSLDDVYCRHIIEGRLPSLMPDTAAIPFAAAMPITDAVPIGKHMSIPIRLADGEVFGMFCCLGPQADPSLNERDLQTMKVFADLVAHEVRRDVQSKRAHAAKIERMRQVIEQQQMSTVYQPIFDLSNNRIAGYECLTRFSAMPLRTPDVWFKEAGEIDRGTYLEISAIALALRALDHLPSNLYLGVNASPQTVVSSEFASTLEGVPLDRVVLEITEHAEVADYDLLLWSMEALRERGMRLAVDDAGAGYSGLQHILKMKPDLIKLDLALTRNIDVDLSRRALTAALVSFARATDSSIIAEGVETAEELAAIKSLGVQKAQGYFLGKPKPLADTLAALKTGIAV